MKRAVLYMRVSTIDQGPETQLYDLRQMAAQRGLEIVQEYTDKISGAKARRPALDQMMADARRGRFDIVLVWASDRVARSVKNFLEVLDELAQESGIAQYAISVACDLRTSRVWFHWKIDLLQALDLLPTIKGIQREVTRCAMTVPSPICSLRERKAHCVCQTTVSTGVRSHIRSMAWESMESCRQQCGRAPLGR